MSVTSWAAKAICDLILCGQVLSQPIFVALQVQGTIIALLLAAGWSASGLMRLRELHRIPNSQLPPGQEPLHLKLRASSLLHQIDAPKRQQARKTASADTLTKANLLAQKCYPPQCTRDCWTQKSGGCRKIDVQCCRASCRIDFADRIAERWAAPPTHAASVDEQAQVNGCGELWPELTVILPVRGTRKHSKAALLSHLGLRYGGRISFLFVVDNAADEAYKPLSEAIAAAKGVDAKLIIAPQATCSSQKIQNILTGLASMPATANFVVCLDDDVVLPPYALQPLIEGLRDDSSLFMATGYPMDVPETGSNLFTYCMMAYHLPLLIALSIRQHSNFVWGGCMVFRAETLRSDTIGIVKAWADGGYSDDLIVAAKCSEAGLKIHCPSSAIFRQTLPADTTWSLYWNYLRRQLYVMDTWASTYNRRLNHGLLLLHSWLSLALVVPFVAVILRVAVSASLLLLLLLTDELSFSRATASSSMSRFVNETALGAQSPLRTSCCSLPYVAPSMGSPWTTSSIAASTPTSNGINRFSGGTVNARMLSAAAFTFAVALAAVSLRWMTKVVMRLLAAQSPADRAAASLGAYRWPLVFMGFWATNALVPFCALYTVMRPSITWSGITYWKSEGKVVRVIRDT